MKITQNAFNGSPMRIYRSMHKLTDFVNNIADVWSCKDEILKSTNDLTKTCRIRKQEIKQHYNFGGRNRSIKRFTRGHTSSSKDVKSILMLS